MAKWNRNFTPAHISADLTLATGTHISAETISRRLNQVGLFAGKHLSPFNPSTIEKGRWCKDHIGWGHQH